MDSLKFNQIGSKKGFWTADLTLKTLIDEYISKIKNLLIFGNLIIVYAESVYFTN